MSYSGQTKEFGASECGFGYRKSIFQNSQYIIIKAVFNLRLCDNVLNNIRELSAKRKASQPQGLSLGSSFKNPPSMSAGQLIDKCGLKGAKYRQAQISNQHANFIINNGTAKPRHVIKLLKLCKKRVYKNFGIKLKEEIIVIK